VKSLQISFMLFIVAMAPACSGQLVEFPADDAVSADAANGDLATNEDTADASDGQADSADVQGDTADAIDVKPDATDVQPDVPDVQPDVADVKADVQPDAEDIQVDVADVQADGEDIQPDTGDVQADTADAQADTADVQADAADVQPDAEDIQADVADVQADAEDIQADAADSLEDVADALADANEGADVTDSVDGLADSADSADSADAAIDVTATAPTVILTFPADLAEHVTTTTLVMARFSQPMQGATITELTFTLMQDATPVTGAVTYDDLTNTATFTPDAPLLLDLSYQATITTGVQDANGTAMGGNYGWRFTTGEPLAPLVLSTSPTDTAQNVGINTHITATFNTPMDPLTINDQTFTLMQDVTPISGKVSYDVMTMTATFAPDFPLGVGLPFQATITMGAKSAESKLLPAEYDWSFTTGACGQAPITLGSAANFAVLAGSTVTSTGFTTVLGDVGMFSGSAITGFPPGIIVGTLHAADGTAGTAIGDLTTAYKEAAGRVLCPVSLAGNIGGMTLYPGLYKSTDGLEISSGDLVLDAQGDSSAVFIFQMATTLITTSGRQVILIGGANAANIYWQVGSSATIGTTSKFFGTVMADQSIAMQTGATLTGRLLARIAAVTLDTNIIVLPKP
jgi:hypothetical protein